MRIQKVVNNKIPGSRHLAESLIDLAETGIYILAEGKFVYISYLFEKLSGYKAKELLGKQSLDLVHRDDRQKVRAAAILMLKGIAQSPYEYRFLNKNGSVSWVSGKVISIGYGKGRAVLGSFWDITEIKLFEKEIAQQQLFLRQVIDANPNFIFVKDPDDRYALVNKALAAAFGSSPNKMEGKSDIELGADPQKYRKYRRDDFEVMGSGKPKVIPEETFTWPSNGELHYYQTVKVPLRDEKGEYTSVLGVSADITERKNLERRLSELATHDPLTGLPNRAMLSDRFNIAAAQANRENKKIAVAMIDLDKFKAVNDTFGHDTGDKLLRSVARRLVKILRKSDTVARIGGDEFILYLPGIKKEQDIIHIADKLGAEFRKPFTVDGRRIKISLSMGIAVYPENGGNLKVLNRVADKLMYKAKRSGRDRYEYSWQAKGK